MTEWSHFVQQQLSGGARPARAPHQPLVGCYDDLDAEYRALADGPALVDRSYRGLLEITGADRASWLHNLTTNEVKNLSPGQGNYAFACNAQGRILFDVNILVRTDAIWVDLDRVFLDLARAHFDKYIIIEDVLVGDRSNEFVRLALVGGRANAVLTEAGIEHAESMPRLGTAEITWQDCSIPVIRHDFCGSLGVELFVPSAKAVELWRELSDTSRPQCAAPAGDDAVQIHRIEAGVPWPHREITAEYLPAETGQFDRAVSFTKGCYLGQEVIERMRTRGVVARRLVSLRVEGDAIPPGGAMLIADDDKPVGQVTSSCRSLARGCVIALGYVKTASAAVGTSLRVDWDDQTVHVVVAELPLTAGQAD
ncbi:MAG: folate-binding protein YgfZ [Phycisphaerales bacterium]|nr:MAG: folate-binding protein YgfZ [Phycisphaerales bacterium]